MTADDIEIGWGAIIETFEMRLVGLLPNVLFLILNHVQRLCFRPYQGI
jgi:hypothetical protein